MPHQPTKVWKRLKGSGYPTWNPLAPLTYVWGEFTLTARYRNAWNHKGRYGYMIRGYYLTGPGFNNTPVRDLGDAKRTIEFWTQKLP